jgi:SAM-dependent methyltransferase
VTLLAKLLRRKTTSSAIDMGDLRRLTPISRTFGEDRGTTIRRHHIDDFLRRHRTDLTGRIMEVGDDRYASTYAAPSARIDVLDLSPEAAKVTMIGDLVTGNGIPDATFDAIILAQVLHVIFDIRAAIATAHRALKPGGVLLATIPTITQVSRFDMDRWGDYWRLTDRAAQRLFEEVFGPDVVTIAYGNVLTAVASLMGLAAEELTKAELDHYDSDYQVLLGVRARRNAGR